MIGINELRQYHEAFRQSKSVTRAGAISNAVRAIDEIGEFIDFIDKSQKEKGRSVITLDQRESYRRLKELKHRQLENKPITPEDDYDNLK